MSASTTTGRGRRPRPAPGPVEDLAAARQAAAQRPAQVDGGARRPARRRRVRRSASFHARPRIARSTLLELVAGELAEVLVAQQLLRAPGQREVEERRRLFAPRVVAVGGRQRSGRRRGRERGAAQLAALAHRAQVERGCALGGLAPEDLEGLVEAGHLVAPAHAEGPRGVGEVALGSDRHVVEGGDQIEHPVGARVEAEAAQHAPEREHVAEQLSRHPAARTRSTIACAACPRTFSTSSWYLRRIPSVSSTMSASSARRSSATRAAAQSSVSATPGSL